MNRKKFVVSKKINKQWFIMGEFVGNLSVAKAIGYSPSKLHQKMKGVRNWHGGQLIVVGDEEYLINVLP